MDSEDNTSPLKDLTPAGLQDLLSEYKEAIEQEFTDDSEGESAEDVRRGITKLIPEAQTTLEYLINNAESESVRFNAAKFVYEVRLGKRLKDADHGDAFADLLSELSKNDTDK